VYARTCSIPTSPRLPTRPVCRAQEPPIDIDWRLFVDDGRNKVSLVSIDRISMALAQRSGFAAIIEHTGERVGGLLAMMRELI